MPTETIIKLQKFGLSKKEADIYLALLQLGTTVASEVAKKGGVNRSTAYVILESLAKKGLAAISIRDGVRGYSPASPERLVQKAEDSAKEYNQLAKLGREMLSELKTTSTADKTKSKIKIFEGLEGIKTVYEDMLESKENIRSYSGSDILENALHDFLPEHRKKMTTKKIGLKIISPDNSDVRKIITNSAYSDSTEHFLTSSHDYGANLSVYDKKVTFISPREKFACIIENVEFAEAIKTLFDLSLHKTVRWNVKSDKKEKRHSREKEPALISAEKRFWKI